MNLLKTKPGAFLITGFALFAMYFGAGNLIIPVMIGVQAGTNLTPATIGFLITGVALPVLGMVAAATTEKAEHHSIAERIGSIPGRTFLIIVFLTTGMLYAVPRVATVSYEMAIRPLLPTWLADGQLGLATFTAIFFILVAVLALNPGQILNRIGTFLTPVLLACLAILIVVALLHLQPQCLPPATKYATAPLQTGLIEGYFTMDAIASLVFGFVVINELRARGYHKPRALLGATFLVAAIAGALLAIIYLGLAGLGERVADQGFQNGAQALANTAIRLFGHAGLLIFGSIVILACLTTAIGLIGSSTQYFRGLLPKMSYRNLVLGQLVVAFGLSNLGLEAILSVVAPINQLIYPVAICLIFVALLEIILPFKCYWTYRLSAWVAAVISVFEACWSTGLPVFAKLRDYLDLLPAGAVHLPWVAPAAIGLLIGFFLDLGKRRPKAAV